MKVVETLPFVQFCVEIDVSFVAAKLAEILSIRSVSSLDLAIQLWRAAFDVGVADAEVRKVPVEFGLGFMSIVRSNFFDAEGELFDDVVDEIDCVGLGMFLIDFQGTNTCGTVNGGIPESAVSSRHFSQ